MRRDELKNKLLSKKEPALDLENSLAIQCALETGTRVWLDTHLPDSWIQSTIAELEIEMRIYIYTVMKERFVEDPLIRRFGPHELYGRLKGF